MFPIMKPAAIGARPASASVVISSKLDGAEDNHSQISKQVIRAELVGSDTCTALGFAVRSPSPVLALCRKLIEAGHERSTRLEAYRGQTLCLLVRSIGEGAELEINGNARLVSVGSANRRIAPPIRVVAGGGQ